MISKRFITVSLYVIIGLVLLLLVVVMVGSNYMVKYSLSPRENRRDMKSTIEYYNERNPERAVWIDKLMANGAFTDTFVVMPSGEQHHAYFIKGDNPQGRSVIVIHGYKSCGYDMMNFAGMFHSHFGYNVIVPDLHGHGSSDGEMIQMGWKDADDILHWAKVGEERFREDGYESKMLIYGISMGAATTMNVSGKENLPPYIKGFIEDCGYTSVWDEFAYVGKRDFGLPKFPILHISSKMCDNRYGWNFQEASPLESVKRCKLPMLFIHGEKDDFVPTDMVYPLFEAKQGEKYIWIAPGSGHGESYSDHPEEYIQQVAKFTEIIGFNMTAEY